VLKLPLNLNQSINHSTDDVRCRFESIFLNCSKHGLGVVKSLRISINYFVGTLDGINTTPWNCSGKKRESARFSCDTVLAPLRPNSVFYCNKVITSRASAVCKGKLRYAISL